jgi:hypothetical protein
VALPPLPCIYCSPDGSACSRCDDDGPAASVPVRELAIDLGNLEGIWADVYARQEALYARHARKARTAWRKATAGLDLAALIGAFRRHALMIPDAPAPGTDHPSPQAAKHHKAELRKLARSMAAGFLAGVNDQPDYSDLLDKVTGALTAASGEGTAAALAVSAAGAGYSGFAWGKAARDGQQEPDRGTVTGWLAKILAGAVTDLAGALTAGAVAGAVAGATAEAMLAAASAVIRKARSVTAFLDQAMASMVSTAMAAAYSALGGIELLDWVTAGSGNVCSICQGYADKSPYTPRDYPATPHPHCRCSPQPRGGFLLPFAAFAAYLIKRAA